MLEESDEMHNEAMSRVGIIELLIKDSESEGLSLTPHSQT